MPTILAVLVLALISPPSPAVHSAGVMHSPAVSTASIPLDRDDYRDAMRKLWEDHVTWTRLFIVSAVAGLPDTQPTAERLLKNQTDIGDAIKPFYGNAAGDKLTALLKEHITTAAEVVTAAKGGDKVKQDDATKRWFANADQIAGFLSEANPKSWPRAEMQKMMRDHLNLTTEEAVARLQGNWAADIAAYDKDRKS